MCDAYGAITHFIAVSTDSSERKWTEEALESLVESMVGVTGMAYLHQVTVPCASGSKPTAPASVR